MAPTSIRLDQFKWQPQYTVLSICVGSYFAVRYAQVVIGPVVPGIIGTFDVSRGQIGIALTGMWITYALSQLPSGVFADRFGERRVVLLALGLTIGATLALAGAPLFGLFALAVLVLGVGAGIYYNAATALLTREFDGTGRAIGTHRIGGQVAGVLAPVVAAAVASWFGWRSAIATGAIVALIAFLLFTWRSVPTPPVRGDTSMSDLFDPGMLRSVLARPAVRYTTLLATLVEFVGLAAMAFLPIFLIEHHGMSAGVASLLFAVYFGAAACCQPIAGWASDRVGRDRTIAVLTGGGALAFGLFASGSGFPVVAPAVVLAGVSMSSMPVIQSRMMDGLTAAMRGTGFGLFRTVYLLIGALGTTVVGTGADEVGWGPSFGLLAVLLGIACISLLGTLLVEVIDRDGRPGD